MKIWLDNGLVDKEQAKVSVFDHGLLYGDGIFEGIRVYGGKIFELDAHLKRLWESARVIRLDIPMTWDQMKEALYQTVRANNVIDGYIRQIVTRGIGDLGLNPFICQRPCVIIIAGNVQLYEEELYEKGLKVVSVPTCRNHPMALPPQVKSLNYLNNIMAKIEAIDAHAGEAIMYNNEGYVAEASGDNVFIVKNGVLYTPPVQAGSLDGITRQVVLRLAAKAGLPVIEKNLTRFDLYVADEFFLTGSAAEVIGVVQIDGRTVGQGTPGPITRQLRKLFFEYARS
ncbi:MAG: branched-chain-amino-acid transaminase [Sedimentisphaerales bacterium]|nr:branched-chain-amino-acid transaminase [Sedimentisphaerales bacterium]